MHILIVDDEPAIAQVLAYALTAESFRTSSCTLGREAIAQARNNPPALILLDVGLPDMNGFDVCREIRTFAQTPIVFLTARNEEIDRIVGLELGADDYVSKPFSPREVVSRVRAILRRTTTSAPAAATSRFVVDREGSRIHYCGVLLNLTRYEFHLLEVLLARPGRILSRSQLMDAVWHDAEESMERTVDAHIKTLRGKLRMVDADHDPIETHRGLGYSVNNEAQ
jgi:two-component system, OmpR family, catabolic regulation response regulator CreB